MKTIVYLSLSLVFFLNSYSTIKGQAQNTETVLLLKEAVKELEQYVKEKGLTPEEYSIDIREGFERPPTKEEIQLVKNSIDEYAQFKIEREEFIKLVNEAYIAGDTALVKKLEKKYNQ